MQRAVDAVGLIDFVCGRSAEIESVHRYVHAGVLFCFCSDECLARFIIDPVQFVVVDVQARDVARGSDVDVAPGPTDSIDKSDPSRAPERAESGPAVVLHLDGARRRTPHARAMPVPGIAPKPAPAVSPGMSSAAAFGHAARVPSSSPRHEPGSALPEPPLGASSALRTLLSWREKRFAARTCKELLMLHRVVSARQPHLSGSALYREIVTTHVGGDQATAEAMLAGAEQSFATWPVNQALRFSDVVHYVAASQFLASNKRARWIHADMKRVVAARIPRQF